MAKMPTYPSARSSSSPPQPPENTVNPDAAQSDDGDWPALPTETEIYILPDGRVVVADLPAELVPLVEQLGVAQPCAVDPQRTERTVDAGSATTPK